MGWKSFEMVTSMDEKWLKINMAERVITWLKLDENWHEMAWNFFLFYIILEMFPSKCFSPSVHWLYYWHDNWLLVVNRVQTSLYLHIGSFLQGIWGEMSSYWILEKKLEKRRESNSMRRKCVLTSWSEVRTIEAQSGISQESTVTPAVNRVWLRNRFACKFDCCLFFPKRASFFNWAKTEQKREKLSRNWAETEQKLRLKLRVKLSWNS